MKMLFFTLIFSSISFAEPAKKEETYQLDPSRQKVITLSKELKKIAGSGDKFDAASALQACDTIAAKMDSQPKTAKPQETKMADWKKAAKKHLPCASETSMELLENIAGDESLTDEPVFNTCVRMVKTMRKTGDCGSLIPTPAERLAIP
jgi:isopenicillin N synthase-like dioxygenase